jgi:hypothetical protein
MMRGGLDPFTFLVVSISGWMNQHQHQVIEYLIEENRILREQIGNRRTRFTDNQRRRLAAKSQEAEPKDSGTGRDHRYTCNAIGLASQVDRPEI